MVPLALSISLDFYLVGRLITGSRLTALLGAMMFVFFAGLWFVLPRSHVLQKAICSTST
jgi:hypothetical protein